MEIIFYRPNKIMFVLDGEIYIAEKAKGIDAIRCIDTIPDMNPDEKHKKIMQMCGALGMIA